MTPPLEKEIRLDIQIVAALPRGGSQKNIKAAVAAERSLQGKYPRYDIHKMVQDRLFGRSFRLRYRRTGKECGDDYRTPG